MQKAVTKGTCSIDPSFNPYTAETCPHSVNEEECVYLPLLQNIALFLLIRNDGP